MQTINSYWFLVDGQLSNYQSVTINQQPSISNHQSVTINQ